MKWFDIAEGEIGVAEKPGGLHEKRVLEYFERVGHSWVKDDETAWCAAFVGWCLEQAGIKSTKSLAARSYEDWGQSAPMRRGAVVVLSRTDNPQLGHVGFFHSRAGGKVFLLSGNQSNAVNVQGFDEKRIVAVRWPSEAPKPVNPVAGSRKATFLDRVKKGVVALLTAVSGLFTADTLGIMDRVFGMPFASAMGPGTAFTLVVVGVLVWLAVKWLLDMIQEDAEDGRYEPSGYGSIEYE